MKFNIVGAFQGKAVPSSFAKLCAALIAAIGSLALILANCQSGSATAQQDDSGKSPEAEVIAMKVLGI